MSLADIKRIDWAKPDPSKWPTYITIGFSIALLGIILVIIGLFV